MSEILTAIIPDEEYFIEEDEMLGEGEEMMMSEEEVCHRFRRNGCYNEHIVILAELNAVYPNDIAEILYRNGLYVSRIFIPDPDSRDKVERIFIGDI